MKTIILVYLCIGFGMTLFGEISLRRSHNKDFSTGLDMLPFGIYFLARVFNIVLWPLNIILARLMPETFQESLEYIEQSGKTDRENEEFK